MATLIGLRASELLSRTPRDLDNGGTVLRVTDNEVLDFKTKNESSKRSPAIHPILQPILCKLAAGKEPNEPLFRSTVETLGGRRKRQWLAVQVERLCRQAGVPKVCAHSLRGLLATTYAAFGVPPDAIASLLGHSRSTMTLNHYIAPGVAEAAQRERGLAALTQHHQPPALPC